MRESPSLTCLPPGVATWTDAERASLLELVLRFATAAPESAASCYRSLPLAVARLDPGSRAALLATLGRFDAASGPEVATVTPVLGAIVETVPAVVRTAALGLVSEIVERSSAAGLAALRSLPRLYEEAQSGGIERWFRAGLAIAVGNPAAGRAFFALESRTSLALLRAGRVEVDEVERVAGPRQRHQRVRAQNKRDSSGLFFNSELSRLFCPRLGDPGGGVSSAIPAGFGGCRA